MAANYLHGVETTEIERGPVPVKTVKSAVIGLVGTAPVGPVNEPFYACLKKTRHNSVLLLKALLFRRL